jgi:signal transduction histidine kinase
VTESDSRAQEILELQTLQRAAQALSQTLDLDVVLGRCLDLSIEVAHADAGALYLREASRGIYELVASRGMSEASAPASPSAEPIDFGFTVSRMHHLDLDHPPDHAALRAAQHEGFRRILALAVCVEERVVGSLVLLFRRSLELPRSTLLTLEALVRYEGVAIENARAHRLVERRAQLAVALREFGERALSPTEGQDLDRLIPETAQKITRGDRAGLVRAVEGKVVVVAASGASARLVGHELTTDAPYLSDSLRQSEPFVVEDTRTLDPTSWVGVTTKESRTASFIIHTMRYRGSPIGQIFTGSPQPRRYSAEELEAVQILSSMAAEALERQRAQSQLKADHRRLDAILERLPFLVAVINREGQTVHLNQAGRTFAESMEGGHTDWREGMLAVDLRFTDGRPVQPEEMLVVKAFAGETPAPCEYVLISRATGRRMNVLSVAAPLPSDDGIVHEVVTGFQDVTALRELADAKDRFLRIASHELRSPLTSLGATTSLLEIDPSAVTDAARRQTLLERVRRQVDRLTRLVEQLLDSARLNAAEVPLMPSDVDLVALCEEAIDVAPVEPGGPSVTLDAEGPVVGHWDPMRIEQVLTNLIGNAIRYSPPGSPAIIVRVRGRAEAGVVEESDHGMGIPVRELDRVFTPFFRGSNVPKGGRGGLGLGLHITSEIVRRHGGTIRVQSEPGQGTTFTVELPRGPAAP